jgi:hypothetical protein
MLPSALALMYSRDSYRSAISHRSCKKNKRRKKKKTNGGISKREKERDEHYEVFVESEGKFNSLMRLDGRELEACQKLNSTFPISAMALLSLSLNLSLAVVIKAIKILTSSCSSFLPGEWWSDLFYVLL